VPTLRKGTVDMKNKSGLQPTEYKVVVKPDEIKMKAGEIYIPEQIQEKERKEQVFGTLVAVGGNAFEDWKEPIPGVGDRVLIAKYAGIPQKGADGQWYNIIYDKDIAAIVEAGVRKDLSESDQPDLAGDGKYGNLRSV